VSLLVSKGQILHAILMSYEYDEEAYVWPKVKEVRKELISDIPTEHVEVMRRFLAGYSGICNFNYKVRADGTMAIFEINTRIGADLACDVPRQRAASLFRRLDEKCS